MNHAKFLTLFTLLIFQFGLFAQSEIRGVVTDAQTGEVIPYANVYFKKHPVGTTAFRDGSFVLRTDSLFNDSLTISCIGYSSRQLYAPVLSRKSMVNISLEPANEELAEVEVQPRKLKTLEIGLAKRRAGHSLGATAKRPYARYMENAYRLDGFISSVSVYVTGRGIPTAPFRIHILSVDEVSGAPSKPLITKDYIVHAAEGNEWVSIDLSKELLSFPPLGFFVSVQALPLDSHQMASYQKVMPDLKPSLVEWYAPSFGHNFERFATSARYNWSYNYTRKVWEPYWRNLYKRDTTRNYLRNHSASSLMIKAEISYYADQEKKVKEVKSKRKVKRVLDLPKKNELEYPQSSPNYLLQSMIKAVQGDEIGYLCAYLLYFDDDEELTYAMDYIKSKQAKSDTVVFLPSERADIVKTLKALEAGLKSLQAAPGERFLYQLNHKGAMYHFHNKNGIWRMSPRSTTIVKQGAEP